MAASNPAGPAASYPLGAAVTAAQLEADPHPVLGELREHEPVSWLPSLGGWLVTQHELVLRVMRDARTFTVDDPRFTTARVIGPSMLSLDGPEHARQRAPWVAAFRPGPVRDRFAEAVAEEAGRLADELAPQGGADLRRGFAGPLAAAVVARALGIEHDQVPGLLSSYDAIVASVSAMTAGQEPTKAGAAAYRELSARLEPALGGHQADSLLAAAAGGEAGLSAAEVISGAAVILFGGIETTEGMIANALLMLLTHEQGLARARADPAWLAAAIEESLRLEPAAAVVDRYATAATRLGEAEIASGDLVRLSISAANRDPAVFTRPDRFDPGRPPRGHLAFAQGPHVCLGIHLARLEARIGITALIERLPALSLDPDSPAEVRGLVFRKPRRLDCRWLRG